MSEGQQRVGRKADACAGAAWWGLVVCTRCSLTQLNLFVCDGVCMGMWVDGGRMGIAG